MPDPSRKRANQSGTRAEPRSAPDPWPTSLASPLTLAASRHATVSTVPSVQGQGRRPAKQQKPALFTVIVWRDQAEPAAQSLAKGSRVVVMGRLQQRSWTAEDGSARSTVEVLAEELGPSLRWATATTARTTVERPTG